MVPDYTRIAPDVEADTYLHAVDGLIHAAKIYREDPWADYACTLLTYSHSPAHCGARVVGEVAEITGISASQIMAAITKTGGVDDRRN